jgi:hypothetical protein
MELQDYNNTEKIADLPKKLSTQDAPEGFTPNIGDIAYYAPWGNIAIFYKKFRYSAGLIRLGTITQGVDLFHASGQLSATIELDQ